MQAEWERNNALSCLRGLQQGAPWLQHLLFIAPLEAQLPVSRACESPCESQWAIIMTVTAMSQHRAAVQGKLSK